MQFQKKHEWSRSAIMYRQHCTFNKRCAPSDLGAVCVCACVFISSHRHIFPVQNQSLSLREEWQIGINGPFCRAVFSFQPYTWGTGYIPEQLFPFPTVSLFFPFSQVLDSLKHPLTVKPNSLCSCSGRSRRREAVHAVMCYSAACALCSLHTTLLPSPASPQLTSWRWGTSLPCNAGAETALSSQTYNLPSFICKETAKFLDMLVLKSLLNLWKASPKDHNLPYKIMCNETNVDEIRIRQDIIVFRTGIGECKQAREHRTCCLRAGREKKI